MVIPKRYNLVFLVTPFLGIVLAIGMALSAIVRADETIPRRDDLLMHLNAVIGLFKNTTTKVQPGRQPSDAIYLSNAESLCGQIVRLAFQSARAEIRLIPPKNTQGSTGQNVAPLIDGGAQKYSQMEAELAKRVADDQAQIDEIKSGISARRKAAAITEHVQALQGKLSLDKATLEAVQKMKAFLESTNSDGSGLEGSIKRTSALRARSIRLDCKQQVRSRSAGRRKNTIGYFSVGTSRPIDDVIRPNARHSFGRSSVKRK